VHQHARSDVPLLDEHLAEHPVGALLGRERLFELVARDRALLDQRLADVPNYRVALRTDREPVTGQTIAELAGKLGVPAAKLEATVAAYNQACRQGTFKALELDGLATEGLDPPKSNWARPIDRPPYQAWPVISSCVFTYGGLKIDANARVLDNDGTPIPGLYAAGETVGMYYKVYTGATSVLKGAVFGRIAGQHASALKR